ncbi:MAG: DUF1573 domain-containing protein [Phycisphaerales bacterium]|nr:DUF1573 domain-containing protein [Phycisphaerales bacterium]
MPVSDDSNSSGIPTRVLWQICGGVLIVVALVSVGSGVFDSSPPVSKPTTPARVSAATSVPVTTSPSQPPPAPAFAAVPADLEREVEVQLEPALYQYGYLRPGEVMTQTIRLTNLDAGPIRLKGTWRGCSCTTLDVSPQVLQPGESIDVPATMTAGLTPTTKTSSVKLELVGRPPVVLPVEGEIIRGVRARPRDIDTYRYSGPEGNFIPTGRTVLDAPEGPAFRVLSVNGEPVESSTSSTQVVTWDVSAYDQATGLNPAGEMVPKFWLVETDHPETPVIELTVRHRAIRPVPRGDRPWFFVEQRINVGGIKAGGWVEFTLPVKWIGGKIGVGDTLQAVCSQSDAFKSKLVSNQPKGRSSLATVRITPNPGIEGPFHGLVTIVGDSFEATLDVIGHAQRTSSQ